jgi:hypothetical protein
VELLHPVTKIEQNNRTSVNGQLTFAAL